MLDAILNTYHHNPRLDNESTQLQHPNHQAKMVFRKISRDVKLCCVNLVEKGLMDLADILDCVGFSERTYYRVLKLYRETGDVVRRDAYRRGRYRALHFEDVDYLVRLVRHKPTWFLDELLLLLEHNRFISVHYSTIHRTLERCNISLKKLRVIARERDDDLRADFRRQMGQYSAEQLGFLDEVSKDERTLQRRYGRAQKNARAAAKGVFIRGRRLSAEGLLTVDGMVASTVVEGSMNREMFLDFMERQVVGQFNILCQLLCLKNLLDALDNTFPWSFECARDGQCTHPPWRGYYGIG